MRVMLSYVVCVLLFGAAFVQAAPPVITKQVTPGTMSYQGHLRSNEGVDYTNGVYTVDFNLYDADVAGTLLWGATYKPYVNNGFFSVILGQTGVGETGNTNATYQAVDEFWKGVWIDPDGSSKHRFLGITVHEDENNATVPSPAESFPRQELQVAPFAIQAQFAQQAEHANLADGSEGDFQVPSANKLLIGNPYAGLNGLKDRMPAGQPESGDLFVGNDTFVDDNLWVGQKITTYQIMQAPGIQVPEGESLQLKGDDNATGCIDMRGKTVFYGDAWLKPGFKLIMDNHEISHIVEAPRAGVRIVAGYIDEDGSVRDTVGDTFTSTRLAEGRYLVTFNEAFSSMPIVVISMGAGSHAKDNSIQVYERSPSSFTVEARDDVGESLAGPLQDTRFHFIAIGE